MMIWHPTFSSLRAFAGGDLRSPALDRVAAHLARCSRCRKQVAQVREFVRIAREATELPLPSDIWTRVEARRARGEEVLLPVSSGSPVQAQRRRFMRSSQSLTRAAVLLFVIAGLASASLPGSPVRDWWIGTFMSRASTATPDGLSPQAVPDMATEDATGVWIAPVDGTVLILVEDPNPELQMRMRLTDDPEVSVQATGAARTGAFRTSAGRVVLVRPGAGELRLEIPRTLPSVLLQVDGEIILRKQGSELYVLAPVADTIGAEFLLRMHPAPATP